MTESQPHPPPKQQLTPKQELNYEENNRMQSSLLMMDPINEDTDNKHIKYEYNNPLYNKYLNSISNTNDNNTHSLSVSPLSSLNASPLHSIRINEEEDDDDMILPTDQYPSLAPKYTNDSVTTSNLSIGSARSSATSQFGTAILPNTNYYIFTSSKCKNNALISSQLIYENMDKYQSQNAVQNSLDDSFKMIDEDEDDEEYYVSDYDGDDIEDDGNYNDGDYGDDEEEEEEEEDHIEFIQEMDDSNDGELETDLNAPTINISSLTASISMESYYDECGDHDVRIPTEFRTLNLNLSPSTSNHSATTTPTTRDDDIGWYNLSNLYSKHSDDEELNINFNRNNKKKMKKKKKLKKKIKKYHPPKHIQQKIDIHKAIKRLSSIKTEETCTKIANTNTKRIKNNNNDQKRNMNSFEFNVESPMEYHNDNLSSFHSFNSFHTDPPSKESVSHQKKFDFSVPPNEIRLSEQACQHLVNLVEYQTGDEMD